MMKHTYIYILLLALVFACQDDVHTLDNDKGLYITRSYPEGVNNMCIIYFGRNKDDADIDDNYLYIAKESINSTDGTKFRLNKTGTLPIGSNAIDENDDDDDGKDRKVVVLANIENTNLNDLTLSGISLSSFRKSVLMKSTAESVLSESDANIPMYVCSEAVNIPNEFPYRKNYYINPENNEESKTYQLLRMMAKFSILNYKVKSNAVSNYEIDGVSLINGYKNGLVCHTATISDTRVTTPSIPDSAPGKDNQAVTTVPEWDADGDATEIGDSDTPDIEKDKAAQVITFYTFEKDNPDGDDEECYIRLDGKIDGTTAKAFKLPIYAINNEQKFDKTTTGPILRNHHYQYVITGINSKKLLFEATVEPWGDAPQGIIFDGQYNLTVDRKSIIWDLDPGTITVKATTDNPNGIQIKDITQTGNWLTVTADGTDANTERNITISVETNITGEGRDGSFYIVSGNMHYLFKVKQLSDLWLLFKSYGYPMDGAQDDCIKVCATDALGEYIPDKPEWTVELDESTNMLTGDRMITALHTIEGGGDLTSNEISTEYYRYTNEVRPAKEVSFEKVKFSVFDDWDNIINSRPGKTHKFVTLIISPKKYKEFAHLAKRIEVLITSVDKENREANSYMMDLAHSNGLSDFVRAKMFTVSRANNSRLKMSRAASLASITPSSRIGATFEADELWTDSKYGKELRGAVSYVKAITGIPNGTDNAGYILVVPGANANGFNNNMGGNTGVAAKVNNVIRWSWQIWIVDGMGENSVANIYKGYGGYSNYMDRNIGAIVNRQDTKLSHHSYYKGYVYQFGRKDPLGAPVAGYTSMYHTFNNEGKTIDYLPVNMLRDGTITIMQSIEEPNLKTLGLTDYFNGSSLHPGLWTKEFFEEPDVHGEKYLWADQSVVLANQESNITAQTAHNGKSIFDPCPFGWRIPVKAELPQIRSLPKEFVFTTINSSMYYVELKKDGFYAETHLTDYLNFINAGFVSAALNIRCIKSTEN
ncbi:hypothetical protein [Bacteroides sp. 519]|uniref:hypothetical protein n=1 Tax=Bacteroides sp. 519 TaxID=2302937 RepID=UPI0013CF69A1|nr:hypothetical protein [Bacteroides sp. 519]NDV59557.1 hypothetical protein [Bacteroides sp. 519]